MCVCVCLCVCVCVRARACVCVCVWSVHTHTCAPIKNTHTPDTHKRERAGTGGDDCALVGFVTRKANVYAVPSLKPDPCIHAERQACAFCGGEGGRERGQGVRRKGDMKDMKYGHPYENREM